MVAPLAVSSVQVVGCYKILQDTRGDLSLTRLHPMGLIWDAQVFQDKGQDKTPAVISSNGGGAS